MRCIKKHVASKVVYMLCIIVSRDLTERTNRHNKKVFIAIAFNPYFKTDYSLTDVRILTFGKTTLYKKQLQEYNRQILDSEKAADHQTTCATGDL